jgi:hypothetical protein
MMPFSVTELLQGTSNKVHRYIHNTDLCHTSSEVSWDQGKTDTNSCTRFWVASVPPNFSCHKILSCAAMYTAS